MRNFLLFLLGVAVVAATVMRVRYGGGEPYPDLSTPPLLDATALEEVLSYPEPIGNVAVNGDGRLFFTVHPESRPQGNKLLEWVDGAAVPFPNGTVQPSLFDTVLGLVVDGQDRLWTIDNGNHGFGSVRLLGFSLDDGSLLHDHVFKDEIAPSGSFLQDLQVTKDGKNVFVADASVWRKKPALIVYDIETGLARRVLESHPSVSPQNYLIRNPIRDMTFAGGIVNLKTGVDGIALDAENEWLYFAAINNSELFRIAVQHLTNPALPARELENEVERFSRKPLNDGLSTDLDGNVYITDIEHGAIFIAGQDRELKTLIRSPKIRWADGLSFGPDGWLYISDSAIPELVLKSKDHIQARGPYYVFRFQPGHMGVPGQ
ncbi:MAG: SMP-30/gluconolactonase/LRE family protein [Woeseiaceae bacterium]